MNIAFFNAIVSRLIALKILKSQNYVDLLTPENRTGLSKTLKLNLLPKNGLKLKRLDKSLVSTQTYIFQKIQLGPFNFLQKISGFFSKNNIFTQNSGVRAMLEIFSHVFNFCKIKCYF